MASVFANRAFGIDISHYQAEIDWDKCDADFVIIKAGEGKDPDPMVVKHVQDAYDHHKPIGLYWFHDGAMYQNAGFDIDPDTWWSPEKDPQLQAIIHECGTKAFNFMCFDHERWWLFYNEYIEYLNGKRPIDQVRRITNGWNSISAKIEMGRIKDWLRATWPSKDNPAESSKMLLYYTGKWFLDTYCPDAKAWIDMYDQWPAQYPYAAGQVQIANLAEFKEKYLPPDTFSPKWLSNKAPFLVQISGDKFVVPWVLGGTGKPSAIDINMSMIPREQFLKLIGAEVSGGTTPPPPGDDENQDDPKPPEPPATGDLAETNRLLGEILAEMKKANAPRVIEITSNATWTPK